MTHLILLRHGIAIPEPAPGMVDDDRPLTEKGESRMEEIAEGLERLGLKLDRIITSPLPRARRTAEIVAEVLGIEDRLENADELRAGRSAASILTWVETRPEERIMTVGHNPSFSDLAGLLAGVKRDASTFELKKGGAAAFQRLGEGYRLDWLATPRLLRRLLD
jgi:phosphohistidine phosphatase